MSFDRAMELHRVANELRWKKNHSAGLATLEEALSEASFSEPGKPKHIAISTILGEFGMMLQHAGRDISSGRMTYREQDRRFYHKRALEASGIKWRTDPDPDTRSLFGRQLHLATHTFLQSSDVGKLEFGYCLNSVAEGYYKSIPNLDWKDLWNTLMQSVEFMGGLVDLGSVEPVELTDKLRETKDLVIDSVSTPQEVATYWNLTNFYGAFALARAGMEDTPEFGICLRQSMVDKKYGLINRKFSHLPEIQAKAKVIREAYQKLV